ncbi:hypothetical protein HMPREF3218_0200438 [Prevotella bivia]|nr:hypothetical protein HMPREF3218_0200438 [Prevotella bivia]
MIFLYIYCPYRALINLLLKNTFAISKQMMYLYESFLYISNETNYIFK